MINIALLGFGTVGSGVYEALKMNRTLIEKKIGQQITVKKILARSFSNPEVAPLIVDAITEIYEDDSIQIVCEMLGGTEIPYEFTKHLLLRGKHVITSNKAVVAAHGSELLDIAGANNCCYLFEASVGGGIPVIHTLTESLIADEIVSIQAILNGTTNFILTTMKEKKQTFTATLVQAQALGYAEKDPTEDVTGIDTARKISILSSLLTHQSVNYKQVVTQGVEDITLTDFAYADSLACEIKLIAEATYTKSTVETISVQPTFVSRKHPLAHVNNVYNSVYITGNIIQNVMLQGAGAGKMPTASAVINDIMTCIVNPDVMKQFYWSDSDQQSNYATTCTTDKQIFILQTELTNAVEEILKKYQITTLAPVDCEHNNIAFVIAKKQVIEVEEALIKKAVIYKKLNMIEGF